MLYWLIILVSFILFVFFEILNFYKTHRLNLDKKEKLLLKKDTLSKQESQLKNKITELEKNILNKFFFYDLARKLAPILEKEELFKVFTEELLRLPEIEEVKFKVSKASGYLEYKVSALDTCYIKLKSPTLTIDLSSLIKLLSLCVEKIGLYEKLQELSIQDSLTSLYNRRYFSLRLNEEFERAKKFNLSLSLLLIDIDHFKNINDTYGHLVGDMVLKEVARLIKENTRQIDLVARLGGEEFIVVLPQTDKVGAILLAERLCWTISRTRFFIFDEMLSITVSIGIASFPQNTIYQDVLLEIVDKALYKAKVGGRNRIGWF